jgi:SAM-dependent methyltransferase
LIAPARQSWDIKANDRYLRAFAEFVRGGSDAKLLIAEWGPDVARAKSLIRELRIDGFVSWFSPAPERRLARMFAAADLVLDQFGAFGTFGLIAPKAMACGTPCLLSFDAGLHAWCFDEPPPLVAAATVGEILDSLRRYLGDDVRRERCGRQSREWIVKHHSKRIVADKINRIAQIVHSSARQRIGFDELRAKRLASIAMAKRVRGISSRVTGAKRLIGKPWRVGKRILSELRHLGDNRDRLARLERRLQEQVAQRDAAFVNVFDVMGQNRLADHNVLTAIRNELLETLVRARLALPFHREEAPVAPRARPALSLADARGKLAAMAPLNWETYVECLDRGTASYQSFPPGSCSTASHAQADLFRGFLRPYLRGQVLDVGCGPQPVPWYLHGYPLDFVRGIDPISRPLDHPFHFVSGFGEFLPWDDEQFDLVISGTSLDHYYLLDVGLREALRVLRPGGHFVAWIAEFTGAPAYDPYTTRLDAAYDSEHLYHIDRAWFLPLITGTGFVAAEVLHFKLPFSYLFMSFQKPFPVPASRNT